MIEDIIELVGEINLGADSNGIELIGQIEPGYNSDKYIQDAINKGISTAINSKLEESY